ncbi:hypothetical protein WICPIJ_006589 [Wickerhamomyces pijperi]|uniref:Secreted protein n=1 Tax=Wickerhamomyces pijperi TaxID=599730 RepID=A0A9P8Q211_WICPI|nr:hypothetical protein WICPIJ_006589 [Wickerhamomyces pijperi]
MTLPACNCFLRSAKACNHVALLPVVLLMIVASFMSDKTEAVASSAEEESLEPGAKLTGELETEELQRAACLKVALLMAAEVDGNLVDSLNIVCIAI